jgi:hypothetical protein
MAIGRWVSGLVPAVSLMACHDPTGPPKLITALPRPLTAAEQRVIEASNEFAFALLREVNQLWADSNVFISPLSASMALGMTLNGARGETFDVMRASLADSCRGSGSNGKTWQRLPVACRWGDSLPPIG